MLNHGLENREYINYLKALILQSHPQVLSPEAMPTLSILLSAALF